jgi:hypothetical protein
MLCLIACLSIRVVFLTNGCALICRGVGSKVRWTNLNPQTLIQHMKSFNSGFPFDTLEDYMKRVSVLLSLSVLVNEWIVSVCEQLYRPRDRRLSAKLMRIEWCHVVSAADPLRRYVFFQVAPQLYSRGWVDPVPDPLLLRKSGSAENRTRDLWSVARNSDH